MQPTRRPPEQDADAPRFAALTDLPFRIIGESPAFQRALAQLRRVAYSDAPVLIEGETGSGKEVAARALHYGGARGSAPFVPLNCGALPDTLFESELFGHERGAFTDARERRRGLVAEADGGTLFLDEVDALAPKAQIALLRFLQDQCFRPLGSAREQQANVRLIAACNRRLSDLVAAGSFRSDLLYRLLVLQVEMPPLRERGADAALLALHFAERYGRKYGLAGVALSSATLAWIVAQPWPGNIRELENWVHRAVLMGEEALRPAAPAAPSAAPQVRYREAKQAAIAAFEREFALRALRDSHGSVTAAAQLAGMERRAFGKLIKRHAIERGS